MALTKKYAWYPERERRGGDWVHSDRLTCGDCGHKRTVEERDYGCSDMNECNACKGEWMNMNEMNEWMKNMERRILNLEKLVYKLTMIQMGAKFNVGFDDKEKYKWNALNVKREW